MTKERKIHEKFKKEGVSKLIKKAEKLGLEYEQKYWGCSQCSLLALMKTFELENEEVFQSASAFGAGIGLTNEGTCGALIGCIMFLGFIYGRNFSNLEKLDRGIKTYKFSKRLIGEFKKKFKHIECYKIQETLMGRTFNLWNEEDFLLFEKYGGHRDKCPRVVAWCAGKTVEILYEIFTRK